MGVVSVLGWILDTDTDTDTSTTTTTIETELEEDDPPEQPPTGGPTETDTGTDVPPVVVSSDDDDDDAPFECPTGFKATKVAGRWVCLPENQQSSGSSKVRPTVGTQPYVTKKGFAQKIKT